MRYFIAAILALVTYSASAGKGILQHAPYETVGPMLGKIGFDGVMSPYFGMGTVCDTLGKRAVVADGNNLTSKILGIAIPGNPSGYIEKNIANNLV